MFQKKQEATKLLTITISNFNQFQNSFTAAKGRIKCLCSHIVEWKYMCCYLQHRLIFKVFTIRLHAYMKMFASLVIGLSMMLWSTLRHSCCKYCQFINIVHPRLLHLLLDYCQIL